MSNRRSRQNGNPAKNQAKAARLREQAGKLRNQVRANEVKMIERHQMRVSWWQRAFRTPLISVQGWIRSRCSALWVAMLGLLGLKPSKLLGRSTDIRASKSARRASFRNVLHAESLEKRQLLAADIMDMTPITGAYVDNVGTDTAVTTNLALNEISGEAKANTNVAVDLDNDGTVDVVVTANSDGDWTTTRTTAGAATVAVKESATLKVGDLIGVADDAVSISIADAEVTIDANDTLIPREGTSGKGDSVGKVNGQFKVMLSGPVEGDTTVPFTYTTDGTELSDFDVVPGVAGSGSVVIKEGETEAVIDVNVIDDPDIETDEFVKVDIGTGVPTNAKSGVILGSQTDDEVTIIDDESEVGPTLTITATDDASTEDTDDGSFTITLSHPSATATTVDLLLTGSTAKQGAGAGDDYTLSPSVGTLNASNELTIPAGETEVIVTVTPNVDTTIEADEKVQMQLKSPLLAGDADITVSAAKESVIIENDDTGKITKFEANDDDVSEPANNGQFTVTMDEKSDVNVVVNYTVTGDATGEEVYFNNFNSNSTGIAFSTTGGGQASRESNTLRLRRNPSSTAASFARADLEVDLSHTVGGARLRFDHTKLGGETDTADDAVLVSPDGGSTWFVAATLAGSSSPDIDLEALALANDFKLGDNFLIRFQQRDTGGAGANGRRIDNVQVVQGDYEPLSGKVTIAPGDLTGTIDISILDDKLLEDKETVKITLDSVSGGHGDVSISGSFSDEVEIDPDDDASTATIAGTDDGAELSVSPFTDDGEFTVTLTQRADEDTTIEFEVAGDATYGEDYTIPDVAGVTITQTSPSVKGEIVITKGMTMGSIKVDVLQEKVVEDDEFVTINLVDPPSDGDDDITADTTPASVKIGDEDKALVNLDALVDTATEDTGVAKFIVQLVDPADGITPVTSNVDTVLTYKVNLPAGSATEGVDYKTLTKVVTIEAGDSNAIIDIEVLPDTDLEPTELVELELVSKTAGDADVSINPAQKLDQIEILDNDSLTLIVDTGATVDGAEDKALNVVGPDATDGEFVVSLAGADVASYVAATTKSGEDLVFTYSLVGSVAQNGLDYQVLSGKATITAGTDSTKILVDVIDDPDLEGIETVKLTIDTITSQPALGKGTAGVSKGATISDTLEITDDESPDVFISGTKAGRESDDDTAASPFAGAVTFSLGGASPSNTLVTYSVTPSGASPIAEQGKDHSFGDGTVTFLAGETEKTIIVPILNDKILEGVEKIPVEITGFVPGGNPAGYTIDAGKKAADVDILEDQTVDLISATDGGEGTVDPTFTIAIQAPSTADTVVDYSINTPAPTDPLDPVADVDTPLTGKATILAGDTTATITVDVKDDSLVENTENLHIELTKVTNVDDPDITLGVGLAGVVQSETQEDLFNPNVLTFEFAVPTSIEDLVIDISAFADIGGGTETVLFDVEGVVSTTLGATGTGAGLVSDSDTIVVSNLDAATIAADGLITITATPTSSVDNLAGTESATVEVTYSDAIPQASVSVTDNDAAYVQVSGKKGKEGGDDPIFTFTQSEKASTDTLIEYVLGTKGAPGDDTFANDKGTDQDHSLEYGTTYTATITAGDLSATVTVPIEDDDIVESDVETVVLTMTSISGDADVKLGTVAGPTISFQQGVDGYTGTVDTFIDSSNPTLAFGSSPEVEVEDDTGGGSSSPEVQEGLLRFEDIFGPDGVPVGAVITSADLDLGVLDGIGSGGLGVYRLLQTFDETATWSGDFGGDGVQPGSEAESTPTLSGSFFGPGIFSVTGDVQDWFDGTATNFGWVFLDEVTGDSDGLTFVSSESLAFPGDVPLLTVTVSTSAEVHICDDDEATVFIDSTKNGTEPGGPLGLPTGKLNAGQAVVKLSDPSGSDTYVEYSISNGTASTLDYVPVSKGTLTIPAGDTEATIYVEVKDDNTAEGTEDVIVTLDQVLYGAKTPTDPQITLDTSKDDATIDILDNDDGKVSVTKMADGSENNPPPGTNTPVDGTFRISTTFASDVNTEIPFTISGDAERGTDYVLRNSLTGDVITGNSVVLPAFLTFIEVTVDVTEDFVHEGDETVTMKLGAPLPGAGPNFSVLTLGSPDTADVGIEDDDDLTVTVVETDNMVVEGADAGINDGVLTITMDVESDEDVVLEYVVSTGGSNATPSATAPDITPPFTPDDTKDYAPLPGTKAGTGFLTGTVMIEAGETEFALPVEAYQDFALEGDETVEVALTKLTLVDPVTKLVTTNPGVTETADPTAGVVTIKDEEFVIDIKSNDSPAQEPGTPPGFNGQFEISVSNDLPVELVVEVSYLGSSTADIGGTGPDPEDDFTFGGSTDVKQYVTILPGDLLTTLDVTVLDDLWAEGTEFVDVKVTGFSIGSGLTPIITDPGATATETILDNDDLEVSITATDGAEPGTKTDDGKFTFNQNFKSPHPTEVTYSYVVPTVTIPGAVAPAPTKGYSATEPGATPGVDFTTIGTGKITIPAGDLSNEFILDVLNDSTLEGDEFVQVQIDSVKSLADLDGDGIGTKADTAKISDDDTAELKIEGTADAGEPSGTAFFEVSMDNPADTDTVVTLSLPAGGTAVAGGDKLKGEDDYLLSPSTKVTIDAGDTSAFVFVIVKDDDVVESDPETVILDIASFTGDSDIKDAVAPAVGENVVEISDDDAAKISVASTTDGKEGGADGKFTFELSKASDVETTFTYTITSPSPAPGGDGATLGDDYKGLTKTGTLTFDPFETSIDLIVDIEEDMLVEDTEKVSIELGTVETGHLGATSIDGSKDSGTVEIADNDEAVISITDWSEDEGDAAKAAPAGTVASFTVTIDKAFDRETVWDVTFADDTATGADYSGLTSKVTIEANKTSATTTIDADVVEEKLVEDSETFTVSITPDAATKADLAGYDYDDSAEGTGEIVNDDTATYKVGYWDGKAFVDGDIIVNESDGTASVTVWVDNPVDIPVKIDVDYTDGATGIDSTRTATGKSFSFYAKIPAPVPAGTDYDNDTDMDTFAALSGGSMFTVVVDIIDDTIVEGGVGSVGSKVYDPGSEVFTAHTSINPDTFDVKMSGTPQGDRMFDNTDTGVVHIVDQNGGPDATTISFGDSDNLGLELASDNLDGQFQLTSKYEISTDAVFELTIDAVPGISGADIAIPGEDYELKVGSTVLTITPSGTGYKANVTLPAGETEVLIDVNVLSDDIVEIDEFIKVALTDIVSSDPNVMIPAGPGFDSGEVRIDDSGDTAILSISSDVSDGGDSTAAEPSDDGTFVVLQSAKATTDSVVSFEIKPGEATPGSDYDLRDADGNKIALLGAGTTKSPYTGKVTIDAGDQSTVITVDVLDDTDSEGTEKVTLNLNGKQPPTNADITVDTAPAEVTIDDDADGLFLKVVKGKDGSEPGNADDDGEFILQLVDAAGNPVTLPVGSTGLPGGFDVNLVYGGVASTTTDYSHPGTKLFFPEGASELPVTIDVDDDLVEEPTEDVTLTIASLGLASLTTGESLGKHAMSTASLDILDNDILPTVESVELNGGDAQRSNLTTVKVTFDSEVTLDPTAFSVEKRSDSIVGDIDGTITTATGLVVGTPTVVSGKTVVELTFDSGAGNSLIDARDSLVNGNYQIKIDATKVLIGAGELDGGIDYVFGNQEAHDFFALYGDSDGDGDVDGADAFGFSTAFFGAYDAAFDIDGDGDVDGADAFGFSTAFFGDNSRPGGF